MLRKSSSSLDRRQLLVQASALATSLWLPRSAWSAQHFDSNPFTLGVASGSPTHDSVVLWTRLAQPRGPSDSGLLAPALTVRWEVAHDPQFKRIAVSGQSQALAEWGHSVHVEVPGLEPDRWYHYRFMTGDAVSATGRTRTFPAPGAAAKKLRVAYASCQNWEHGYYSAYRHMRAEQLDVVMFLGDYIYEYPSSRSAVRPSLLGWTLTLADYRARYALYKSDPDLQAMHAECPWLMTWDDHEVQNDYAALTAGYPGPVGNFAQRRAAAYQAYYENMPLRASVLTKALKGMAGGAEMRIYSQVPFGNLATLYLLDDRQYRDAQVCTKGDRMGAGTVNPAQCAAWTDPKRTLLGADQEQWLDRAFSQSGGRWNVVGQQTVFGRRDFALGEGHFYTNDTWDGYSAARTRLTDSIQRHGLDNPVLLGGDVHANWVGHVKADYDKPASASVGVEFCGTSISSHGGSNTHLVDQLAKCPHFVMADREHRGYGVVEFTPKHLTTALRVVDNPTRTDSGVSTLAHFVVEAGRPVVQQV